MTRNRAIDASKHRSRGTVYLFALGACSLVMVAGVTAVRIAGVGLSSQAVSRDAELAGREADATMHLMAELLLNDPSGAVWREDSRYQLSISGLSGPARTGATANVRIEIVDPVDGELRDDPTERLQISAVAVVGDVQRTREFQIEPVVTNLTCLSYTLLYGSVVVLPGKTLHYNGSQATIGAGQVTSPRMLNSAAIRKATGVNLPPEIVADSVASSNQLFVPTTDSIVAAFRARGASEVTLSADLTLDNELVSPSRFSLGVPNAEGLYIIDANGFNVVIKDSRIRASLVIIDANKQDGVHLQNSVTMEPAFAGLPTLVVSGDLVMEQSSGDLLETTAARNLNPVGAPYMESTDADTADAYPSLIRGVVYVDGALTVGGKATIHGQLFVSSALNVHEELILRSDLIETHSPVPGFSMPTAMRLVPESVTGN